MNFSHPQIVLQELPGEIALAFSISGCPLRCPGCHSAFTWDPGYGEPMTEAVFDGWLTKYRGLISAVLFYGGEWEPEALCLLLERARAEGLRTCLYTGEETVPESIRQRLDYLKTGAYVRERGGLESRTTNQQLIHVLTGTSLNHHFWRKHHVAPQS